MSATTAPVHIDVLIDVAHVAMWDIENLRDGVREAKALELATYQDAAARGYDEEAARALTLYRELSEWEWELDDLWCDIFVA